MADDTYGSQSTACDCRAFHAPYGKNSTCAGPKRDRKRALIAGDARRSVSAENPRSPQAPEPAGEQACKTERATQTPLVCVQIADSNVVVPQKSATEVPFWSASEFETQRKKQDSASTAFVQREGANGSA